MNDAASGRFLWQGRLLRRRVHRWALSACSQRLRRLWFDERMRTALRHPHRPALPFVLADAVLGADLVFAVDPRRIEFFVPKYRQAGGRNYLTADWFVFPGEWGRAPIAEDAVYRCMRELIATGENFMQAASFRAALLKLETSGPHMHNGRHVESAADIEAYYRRYLDIAASLRGKGFEPGRADAAHDPFVGVAIDSSGAVVHCQKGHHRFALAREQGIRSIPVKVRMVHTEWLRGNLTGEVSPHRGLADGLRRHFQETRHA